MLERIKEFLWSYLENVLWVVQGFFEIILQILMYFPELIFHMIVAIFSSAGDADW